MVEQKKSNSTRVATAIRWVVAIVGLILLIAKGFGAGIGWITILGVLAIPGALGVIGVSLAIPMLIFLGIASIISNSSK